MMSQNVSQYLCHQSTIVNEYSSLCYYLLYTYSQLLYMVSKMHLGKKTIHRTILFLSLLKFHPISAENSYQQFKGNMYKTKI